ncbi:MAG TPA: hypothetical protein DCE31_02855 [Lautropia sp.]|nr:hypothetical protein [Lautropia sp.]
MTDPVQRTQGYLRLITPFIVRYAPLTLLSIAMVVCVYLGGRYEREFRSNLEQGFQQRVELGDLASSVQQLRKTLEAPRILDPGFVGGLIERSKEVEVKARAQSEAGRIGDLVLPVKELSAIVSMQQGLERLSVSAGQVERAYNLKTAIKPPEYSDAPAIKKVSAHLDDYVGATGALRNARSASNALASLQQATMALGEHLATATTEARRKTVSQGWRDVYALLPSERGDLIDRLLADGRMLEELQNQRLRAISKLEQVAAKIDSAERLLLQSRSSGGLLVVATLMTWGGVFCGLLGTIMSMIHRARAHQISPAQSIGERDGIDSQSVIGPEQLADVAAWSKDPKQSQANEGDEKAIASQIATEIVRQAAARDDGSNLLSVTNAQVSKLAVAMAHNPVFNDRDEAIEAVTSGYWIASGSMAERRVALLDRQSLQLEQHVRAVMAAAETLSGRLDVVAQSLQLAAESDKSKFVPEFDVFRRQISELQAIAMNLSIQASSGEATDTSLDELERFGEQLDRLSAQASQFMAVQQAASIDRRLSLSLDETRRMAAAADTLRERTEMLLEDAQRFRRQSEALIRGIQEGAVAELPASFVRPRNFEA